MHLTLYLWKHTLRSNVHFQLRLWRDWESASKTPARDFLCECQARSRRIGWNPRQGTGSHGYWTDKCWWCAFCCVSLVILLLLLYICGFRSGAQIVVWRRAKRIKIRPEDDHQPAEPSAFLSHKLRRGGKRHATRFQLQKKEEHTRIHLTPDY